MGESTAPPRAAGWYADPPGGWAKYGYWDGSAWRQDVTAAVHLMNDRFARSSIRRGALARIGEFVAKDERVDCITAGSYYTWGNQRVSVVLTERRLLLLIGGRRTADVREYPRESISFARSGLGSITVIANGKKLRINNVNSHDTDDMVHAIRDRSSDRWTGPDLGKIRRLRVTEE